MRQLLYTTFRSNNQPSLHLWWKKNFVKHWKVSKYYGTDCLKSFLLLLVPTNFFKSSHLWDRYFFIFLKTVLNQILTAFITKLWCQWTDLKSSYQRRESFALFCNVLALTLAYNSVERLRLTKIVQEIKFKRVWDNLGSKKFVQRESVTKYLRLTLVFMKNSALRERFNCYFSGLFC